MTNQYQTKRRERILASGGSQVSVFLNREATTALAAIQAATGESQRAVLERLLITGGRPCSQP